MKKLILILLVILINSCELFSQWAIINPYPTGNTLNSVFFIDQNVGWTVGVAGTLYKTTNGGGTWFRQNTNSTVNFYSIQFISSNVGWILGSGSTILKSVDGGESWTTQNFGTLNQINSVFFGDTLKGWAGGNDGIILRTIDGGATWNLQSLGIFPNILQMFFIDLINGWATVGSGIIKTTNGGTNWNLLASGTPLPKVYFINSNVGYSWNSFEIRKTTNGGNSWITQYSGISNQLTSVHFIDTSNGWACTNSGQIVKTSNGGMNWALQSSGFTNSLNSIQFYNAYLGWTVGVNGKILHTTDGGSNWIQFTSITSLNLNGIDFLEENLGFAVADSGKLLKTTDGGISWNIIPTISNRTFRAVKFIDSLYGYIAGDNVLLRTSDGGNNWSGLSGYNLSSISFVTKQIGWVAGDGGILKTSDGGINWFRQGGLGGSKAIFFVDSLMGWLSDDTYIRRTTDGGFTWNSQGYKPTVKCFHFISHDLGWGAGSYGYIYKTQNGGTTWTLQQSNVSNEFRSIMFVDSNIGWVVGSGGIILKTLDGGSNWIIQPSGTVNPLSSLEMLNSNVGYTVGSFGIMLKTTNGGVGTLSLKLTSPSGGEIYKVGTTQNIKWNSNGINSILIEYTTNNGTSWNLITSSTNANIGVYAWVIPNTVSLFCKVKVTDINDSTRFSVSDSNFIISYSARGDWSADLKVSDATVRSQTLSFGRHPNATDGLDSLLGEFELPPTPPTGVFDARMLLPTSPQFSSYRDYRDTSANTVSWTMKFQPGSGGYPFKFEWSPRYLPYGNIRLKDLVTGSLVNVNMKKDSIYYLYTNSISSLKIEFTNETCVSVPVSNDWNIISVPVVAKSMVKDTLFPSAISLAYAYNNGYTATSTLTNGKGYWLKFSGSQNIEVCGGQVGLNNIPVLLGWNLMGIYENNIPISGISSSPSGIISSSFFGYSLGYFIPDSLMLGKGYWIKVSQNGVLNIPTFYFKTYPSNKISAICDRWGKIIVEDRRGNKSILYVTDELINLSEYELPPLPPSNIFDVRFEGDRFVENIIGAKNLKLQSNDYPISISVENLSIHLKDRVNGEFVNMTISNGEKIIIDNKSLNIFEISLNYIPLEYKLSQNYPNPFNPKTNIDFALPKKSMTIVSVYNCLGEKIIELLNRELEPGNYSVNWDGRDFTSGVYFYELITGTFRQTKKMILIK